MKNVLVTGALGFIGRNVALYFYYKGYNVLGWDKKESKDVIIVNEVDMMNEKKIINNLVCFKPDVIIHCAGAADVGKSLIDPQTDYDGSVTITHKLLFAIQSINMYQVKMIYLSSAGVYGNPKKLPIDEKMKLNPLSPYAVHKIMCEELCMFFREHYKMDIKIARIFSAYGVGLKKQIFWDMLKKYKSTGRLDMFGTGNESRDFIHVDDVAQSLYLLVNSENRDFIYNIANGEEITIKTVSELFADCMGFSKKLIYFNGVIREGDPLNWRADIERIKRLGYERSVNMVEAISEYIEWAEREYM